MNKKVLQSVTALLSVLFVFTFFPVAKTYADTSGTCGDNLQWELDSNGKLTVSGSGAMYDWNNWEEVPWYNDCNRISSVVIEEGVTSVGNYSFMLTYKMETLSLPDSLEKIGGKAFFNCNALTDFTLPDSLTYIGNQAFACCTKITNISVPNGVESVGFHVFDSCTSLETCSLPENLISIDEGAFQYCVKLKNIKIPDTVTSIGESAFSSCKGLEDIVLPAGLTTIGNYAFSYCSNLSSVTISGNTEYSDNTFSWCDKAEFNYYYDTTFTVKGDGKIVDTSSDLKTGIVTFRVEPDQDCYVEKVTFKTLNVSDTTETKIDPSGGLYSADISSDNIEITAYFEHMKRKVTFLSESDGTIYQSGNCNVGSIPVYKGDPPEKEGDAQFSYAFEGWFDTVCFWDKDVGLPTVEQGTDDICYYAVFDQVENSYKITFVDENDKELQSDTLVYGKIPSYSGETPVKAEDDSYIYTFSGWTPEITKVTGDATYKAVFTSEEKEATVKPEIRASFEEFVERLYVVALDRPSDPEGKKYWTEQVISGNLTGADSIRAFFLCREFEDRNLTDEQFVTVLYKAIFNRDASADKKGYDFWMNTLTVAGRDWVVEGFINSPEWCDVCASYCVKSGASTAKATTASYNTVDFATRLYTECLGRTPDEEGLLFWSLGLTNLELTGSQAAHEFFYSSEFIGLDLDNKELITRMYKTFMGREPDNEGLSYWLDAMEKSMTKDELFKSFVDSKEFSDICVSYAINKG